MKNSNREVLTLEEHVKGNKTSHHLKERKIVNKPYSHSPRHSFSSSVFLVALWALMSLSHSEPRMSERESVCVHICDRARSLSTSAKGSNRTF